MYGFTESEISSKERRLQELDKKVTDCLAKEKNIRAELDHLQRELTYKNSSSRLEQIHRSIDNQERKLADVLRERERYDRERKSLSEDLDGLRRSLAWESSLRKEEEKRKQAQEKAKRDLSRMVAFSAGAIVGTMSQKNQTSSQCPKKQKGSGARIPWKVILLLVIVCAIWSKVSPQNAKILRPEDETAPVVTAVPSPSQDQAGLDRWLDSLVSEVYDQYGETDLTGYMNGGSYFYYDDQAICPYEFFYEDTGTQPTPDQIIYGVGTGVDQTPVTEKIWIGENLLHVEEATGISLQPEALEGSDFYPYLEAEPQIDGVHYHFLFGPESKNLVYALAIKK